MLSVEQALALVLSHAEPLPASEVALEDGLGLRLAQDVASDVDSPPHDKAMVDGYAVRVADLAAGEATLTVIDEVMAGDVPHRAVTPGTATRIMTGAPTPEGADGVVMVEQTELVGDRVTIRAPRVSIGMNLMRRGTALRRGEVVMQSGRLLRPIEIGLLSEVGCTRLQAIPRPRVAILATGNELVPPDETPTAGKIRNSNCPMLAAAVAQAGALPIPLGIARDEPAELCQKISAGLACDVLLLTGGVSAGQLDLVPGTLEQLGVQKIFHKINLKPGKPLWFGVLPSPHGKRLVFGLPGNPVSTFVCFQLFVRPALARLAGAPDAAPHSRTALLTHDHTQRGDRASYHPALLQSDQVTPLPWHGSADLHHFAAANALLALPSGDTVYTAGSSVRILEI